jgi:hypothetical protein
MKTLILCLSLLVVSQAHAGRPDTAAGGNGNALAPGITTAIPSTEENFALAKKCISEKFDQGKDPNTCNNSKDFVVAGFTLSELIFQTVQDMSPGECRSALVARAQEKYDTKAQAEHDNYSDLIKPWYHKSRMADALADLDESKEIAAFTKDPCGDLRATAGINH